MRVVFSMDGIKNMDLLYTWTEEHSEAMDCTDTVEHYHGDDYCKSIINALTDWQEKKYIGCRDRIANEVFTLVSSTGAEFPVSCPVDEELRVIVSAEYSIDDALGEDSTCHIVAKNYAGEEVCKAELHFHNGDGCEGEEGLMDDTDDTVYDSSELDDFKDELFISIDDLNPYPAKADAYTYENK